MSAKSLTIFIKIHLLIGAFVKLWKATVTCIMSVLLEWLTSLFMSFHEILFGKMCWRCSCFIDVGQE